MPQVYVYAVPILHPASMPIQKSLLKTMQTNRNRSVLAASAGQTVFLVFLRHFGCSFCREALNDISGLRKRIADMGFQLIFVHMSDEPTAEEYFQRFGLSGSEHVSDPLCRYYQGFGLVKGTFNQLLGFHNFIRGIDAGVFQGHGVGKFLGDGFQMPGLFLIQNGDIVQSFIHKYAGERPDYIDFLQCCPPFDVETAKAV